MQSLKAFRCILSYYRCLPLRRLCERDYVTAGLWTNTRNTRLQDSQARRHACGWDLYRSGKQVHCMQAPQVAIRSLRQVQVGGSTLSKAAAWRAHSSLLGIRECTT